MNSEWPVKRISEIAYFLNSRRIPLKSLDRAKRQGSYPYYGASGIVDNIDDYIFDGVYLLISEDGENLRTRKTSIAFKAEGKFWVNNHAHILSEREEGVLDYLEYYFSTLDLNAYITGAVQPKLNKASLDLIEIPFPKKETRLFINSTLNSLTKKIDLNKKINQTLEQMAKALFKSWFVDFEPVKAKITAMEAGGTLEDATLAAMTAISGKDNDTLTAFASEQPEQYAELKATAELFPAAMQESELGEIPQGWEVSSLAKRIKLVGGGTPKRSEPNYWGGDICWYSVKDAPSESDIFVIDTTEKITPEGLAKSSAKLLPIGTTIISARGTVGKLALTAVETAMNQSCYGISGGKYSGPFLTYLKVKQCIDVLKRNTHGAVFDTITTNTFDTVNVLTAHDEINSEFEKCITPLFDAIKVNLMSNSALKQLRDTLLPKLLSGEITLPEAEAWTIQTEPQEA